MKESLQERIRRAVSEDVAITEYNPGWPMLFEQEKKNLLACLPHRLIRRIEHFGSTAVQGLAAKPIIDMLVEVTDLKAVRNQIVPILESRGYDYFWRPAMFEGPPFYAWFIKRNASGTRTHHIHMVEAHFEHWQRLLFRDYLREKPKVAADYAALKKRLAADHPNDRAGYTRGKTEFVAEITARAKRYYGG